MIRQLVVMVVDIIAWTVGKSLDSRYTQMWLEADEDDL